MPQQIARQLRRCARPVAAALAASVPRCMENCVKQHRRAAPVLTEHHRSNAAGHRSHFARRRRRVSALRGSLTLEGNAERRRCNEGEHRRGQRRTSSWTRSAWRGSSTLACNADVLHNAARRRRDPRCADWAAGGRHSGAIANDASSGDASPVRQASVLRPEVPPVAARCRLGQQNLSSILDGTLGSSGAAQS